MAWWKLSDHTYIYIYVCVCVCVCVCIYIYIYIYICVYVFFFLNKKVLGAKSGVHVTLDHHAHARIIASCSDFSVAGNQPKPLLVRVIVCCIDYDRENWAVYLHKVLPETWALMLGNLQYDSQGFWEWVIGPYTSKEVVLAVQRGTDVSWEWWMFQGGPSQAGINW